MRSNENMNLKIPEIEKAVDIITTLKKEKGKSNLTIQRSRWTTNCLTAYGSRLNPEPTSIVLPYGWAPTLWLK